MNGEEPAMTTAVRILLALTWASPPVQTMRERRAGEPSADLDAYWPLLEVLAGGWKPAAVERMR